MKSLQKVLSNYKTHVDAGGSLRLGQFFVNRYIKQDDLTTAGLFYETDNNVAESQIEQWLLNNQYIELLPVPINPIIISANLNVK